MIPNDNQEVTMAGTISYKDYKKYASMQQKKVVLGCFAIAMLLFILLILTLIEGTPNLIEFMVILMFASIMSFFYTTILIILLRWRNRREYKSDQMIKKEVSVTFTAAGVEQKSKRSIAHFEWGDFILVQEGKGLLLLFVSKNKAVIVPKRHFSSELEVMVLKKLIVENVGPSKTKIKYPS
ncbi:YcxB family protein [Shouchella sp. 1P09AA]|uniref:YcxB family protein n=1 Tax=unclassified Shouchella TaxID=2893065 RepID=UPI0039A34D71